MGRGKSSVDQDECFICDEGLHCALFLLGFVNPLYNSSPQKCVNQFIFTDISGVFERRMRQVSVNV